MDIASLYKPWLQHYSLSQLEFGTMDREWMSIFLPGVRTREPSGIHCGKPKANLAGCERGLSWINRMTVPTAQGPMPLQTWGNWVACICTWVLVTECVEFKWRRTVPLIQEERWRFILKCRNSRLTTGRKNTKTCFQGSGDDCIGTGNVLWHLAVKNWTAPFFCCYCYFCWLFQAVRYFCKRLFAGGHNDITLPSDWKWHLSSFGFALPTLRDQTQ